MTSGICGFRRFFTLLAALIFSIPLSFPQDFGSLIKSRLPHISASGGVTVIPFDNWASGSFNQLMSVINPISAGELDKLLDIHMDATATTIYEGDLWFKRLGLTMGFKVNVDDNFIGRISRLMGYLGYRNTSIRLQTSRLRGSLSWDPSHPVAGMPNTTDFDNRFITVDLLYYPKSPGSDFYFGVGYQSYELPTQIECLVLNPAGSIVYGRHVYQPDMKFRIYSFLFGFDTLKSAFMEVPSLTNTGDGFGFWAATQDRFGGGMSRISDETEAWIEAANPGRFLRDNNQIIMMVDYNLTLGVRWTGNRGPVRIGAGLGYNVGGQVIMAMSSSWGPITRQNQVDASPDLFLFHHGVIFTLSASF